MQWYSASLFSLSLLVTTAFYGSIQNAASFPEKMNNSGLNSQNIAITSQNLRGNRIILNGREFNIAWVQFKEGNQSYLGISDTGAREILGFNLVDSKNNNFQSIQWYSDNEQQTLSLPVYFQIPYRYLNVSELFAKFNINWSIQGDSLVLNLPPSQITNLRQGNQPWGQRIVIDLDRPTVWQVSQNPTEGVVMIEGVTSPPLLTQYPAFSTQPKTPNDEDDLGSGNPNLTPSQLVSVENSGTSSKIKVKLPPSQGLQVFSVNNPPRIIIDVRPDYKFTRNINWTKGIQWRQQPINLRGDIFPVTWLEVDQKSPQIQLKPITNPSNTLEGITPLVTLSRASNATAAINGGFFNRNNQLPLGAIRRDNQWLSSPILNRGAIAWDNQGNVKMGRLSLQETLITGNGQRFPVLFLNSAYLKDGIARYTPAWGQAYTPLTDDESIITVRNNQVIQQNRSNKAGTNSFNIPSDGYLIIIRKNVFSPSSFPVGTSISLQSQTNPLEMGKFPHIIGAGPLLLQKGQIVLNAEAEGFNKAFQSQKASRSAIAVNRQGKLMIVAVHNRIGGKGASLDEFAELLLQMGAVEALNLDGGSSTSLSLGGQLIDRSPVTAARVHNGIGIFLKEEN